MGRKDNTADGEKAGCVVLLKMERQRTGLKTGHYDERGGGRRRKAAVARGKLMAEG